MLVLHDPDTLLHKSKEILGSRLIDALECPERIEAIVKAIQDGERHELYIVGEEEEMKGRVEELLKECLEGSHDGGYVFFNFFNFEWFEGVFLTLGPVAGGMSIC